MISLPVKPEQPITAKSLAQQLDATLVIRLDADNQELVGYVPDHLEAANFDIGGGMGVIVNLIEEKEVTFTGQVWDNVSAAPTTKPFDSSGLNRAATILEVALALADTWVGTATTRTKATEVSARSNTSFPANWKGSPASLVKESGETASTAQRKPMSARAVKAELSKRLAARKCG